MVNRRLSQHIAFLLRHKPEAAGLAMDRHGWVSAEELISAVNAAGKYRLNREILEEIVSEDSKGRYRFSEDGIRIKACQGHSVPWVEPELTAMNPPPFLYHGTTAEALSLIRQSGAILPMGRHAVHMQADPEKAWASARRWRGKTAVVLKIDAEKMAAEGWEFALSENGVWFCDRIPCSYFTEIRDAAE